MAQLTGTRYSPTRRRHKDCPQRASLFHPSSIIVHLLGATVFSFPLQRRALRHLSAAFPFSLTPNEADHYSPPVASRERLRPRPGEESSRSISLCLDVSIERGRHGIGSAGTMPIRIRWTSTASRSKCTATRS